MMKSNKIQAYFKQKELKLKVAKKKIRKIKIIKAISLNFLWNHWFFLQKQVNLNILKQKKFKISGHD